MNSTCGRHERRMVTFRSNYIKKGMIKWKNIEKEKYERGNQPYFGKSKNNFVAGNSHFWQI